MTPKPATSDARKLADEVAGIVAFRTTATAINPGKYNIRLNGGGRLRTITFDEAVALAQRITDQINDILAPRVADARARAATALDRLTIRSTESDVRLLQDAIEEVHASKITWAAAVQTSENYSAGLQYYVAPATDGATIYGTQPVVFDIVNAIDGRLATITEPLLEAAKARLESLLK